MALYVTFKNKIVIKQNWVKCILGYMYKDIHNAYNIDIMHIVYIPSLSFVEHFSMFENCIQRGFAPPPIIIWAILFM